MYIDPIDFLDFNPTMLFCVKGVRNVKEIPHKHTHMEIAYIISNRATFEIDGVRYDVKEGDFVIINPEQTHSGLIVSPENLSEEFFVGFSDFTFNDMPQNTLFKGDFPIITTNVKARKNILYVINQMLEENNQEQTGKHAILKSYLVQFILLAIREKQQQHNNQTTNNKSKVSEEITKYFYEHFSEKISLDQIAKNMYLSPFYISKIFKEEVGESPINHLIKIRLEMAKELLLNEDLSVKEVSFNVGYEDAYHFSKIFKKYYGVSPIEYKKMHI